MHLLDFLNFEQTFLLKIIGIFKQFFLQIIQHLTEIDEATHRHEHGCQIRHLFPRQHLVALLNKCFGGQSVEFMFC